MTSYDYLIIGGGVAGVTAAETIREQDPRGSLAVISGESHPLYSRVLLPRFVKGLIRREQVFLRTAEGYRRKGIEFFSGTEAFALDAGARRIRISSGDELEFGKLLIAGGGRPRPLGIRGENFTGVSRFQTLEDAERIREDVSSARQAVVVGGGFIALEYLDILSRAGIPTSLVLTGPHAFSRFVDSSGGEFLHDHFRRHGIESIVTGDGLAEINGSSVVSAVRTDRGETMACDFLGIGIGLVRTISWLSGSGIASSPRGVITDEFLETGVPGIFAAGDIAEFAETGSGRRVSGGTWTNAVIQGRIAGRNMVAGSGDKEPYRTIAAYSITCLGWPIACIGETGEGPDVDAGSRIGRERDWYERFFFRGERMVGAVLINRPENQRLATMLIRDGVPLGAAKTRFADPAFDISMVIP